MTEEEYKFAVKQNKILAEETKKEQEQRDYAAWFYKEHEEIYWEDEYGSCHTEYRNKKTGRTVQSPSFWVSIYKPIGKKKEIK